MKSFKQFLNFIYEAPMSSGADYLRHKQKYIDPNIGKENHFTLDKSHGQFQAGTKLTVHGTTEIKGKPHVEVTPEGSNEKTFVPVSKVKKPKEQANKGFDFETGVVKRLNEHGLMHGSGAGFTGGNDFHLINKKTGELHEGKMAESIHQGETKKDLSAAFGQASLKYHPEKGWHFEEKTKKKFPEYTKAIENAHITVNGMKKPLIHHINDTFGPLEHGKKSSTNVYSDETDLHPMHSYLKDHHVDVLHVGSHGTYSAGLSKDNDRTGIGLPTAEGKGKFRIRQKHPTSLTVQFNVKDLKKSHINLEDDNGLSHIKKSLGHI